MLRQACVVALLFAAVPSVCLAAEPAIGRWEGTVGNTAPFTLQNIGEPQVVRSAKMRSAFR